MTPAIKMLERHGATFELLSYEHDPRAAAYGEEAARALSLEPRSVFKTLVARLDDGRLVTGIVPVTAQLDLKALAKSAGARRASMADATEAERATGYVLGGISPLGQKKRLLTFLDESAVSFTVVHVSGGRRGLEIRLAPDDLVRLTSAKLAPLARY
ncbi:Cys-tRNA(Pro) deacylase [Halomonas sp. ANAO-440]|uniref:Cys-tRNA(Pro) deacylase n=1 Tax=Halomonas sp. ANAO-440 TaxID=2861360 RepID=UPI001CAA4602|nr:Cys-tRNA(Pro) deacylase [Halomonas sp. ANAO-440]MBZ0330270.1 Cys-tRNA(Pro) deacylase [Halomonas sp. ANAO-440]